MTYGTEVYHVVFGSDRTSDQTVNSISEASHIPVFLGAVGLLSAESQELISIHKTLSKDSLLRIAETVRCVFAGAYDGEGFVLWGRGSD